MSVFHEFQKLWAQKFPDSSLSAALEADIKDSLTRHKDKIRELSDELEQEKLYCKYLEKLLSDVAKNKGESEPAATTTAEAAATPNQVCLVHFFSLFAVYCKNSLSLLLASAHSLFSVVF